MKLFPSHWLKVFIGMATLVVLVFLSDTSGVAYLRESTLALERALSDSRVGAFLFPRAARELPSGPRDVRRIQDLEFQLEAVKKENELLRDALDFSRSSGASVKAANVFLYSNELGKETLLIDAGTDAGIGKGALVLDSSFFLVGTVAEAGKFVSKIDIASNVGNTFEAHILPGGAVVVAKGVGGGVFLLDLVPIDMPVRKGDFVGFAPKRGVPYATTIFFLGEVVGESRTESTIFKAVRAVSPVVPAVLTTIFILP